MQDQAMQNAIDARVIHTTHTVGDAPDIVSWMGEADGRKVLYRRHLAAPTLILFDVLVALLCWGTPTVIQSLLRSGGGYDPVLMVAGPSLMVWVLLRTVLGLYPGYALNQVEDLRRQTYATLATLAVTAIFAYSYGYGGSLSPWLAVTSFLGLLVLIPVARYLIKRILMKTGLWGKPVAVLGSRGDGTALLWVLRREWQLGLNPVLLVDDRSPSADGELEVVSYRESVEDSFALARNRGVDTAIFAMPRTRREDLARQVEPARENFQSVIVMPNLDGITNSAVVARDFAGSCGVEIRHNLLDPSIRLMKRALDFTLTCVVGVVALPLLALLTLLVFIFSGRPVFYDAHRMGKDGKVFACIKFRTMVLNGEDLLQKYLREDPVLREEYVRYHKLRQDPRVTRIGRFLRKTSLDELPQLWNVLRGEMSLVGPRPYLPRESADIGRVQGEILRVPPGVTGMWQVQGRNSTTFGDRVKLDAYYVHNWSVWLDLVILARTAGSVLFGRGAR